MRIERLRLTGFRGASFIFYAVYNMRNAGLEEAHAGLKIAGRMQCIGFSLLWLLLFRMPAWESDLPSHDPVW